jgi:hypothetical protein
MPGAFHLPRSAKSCGHDGRRGPVLAEFTSVNHDADRAENNQDATCDDEPMWGLQPAQDVDHDPIPVRPLLRHQRRLGDCRQPEGLISVLPPITMQFRKRSRSTGRAGRVPGANGWSGADTKAERL